MSLYNKITISLHSVMTVFYFTRQAKEVYVNSIFCECNEIRRIWGDFALNWIVQI